MKTNPSLIIRMCRPVLLAAVCLAALSAWLLRAPRAVVEAQQAQLAIVSAAGFGNQTTDANLKRTLAPDSAAAVFGNFVTQNNQVFAADRTPLPTTLGGVTVQINGVNAGLFFVAPTQINIVIPPNLTDNANATVRVLNSNNTQLNGTCIIGRTSPGLFGVRGTGTGPAAAVTTFDGVTFSTVYNLPDLSPRDVDAGTSARPNVVVFFGTGLRLTPAANPNDANGVAEAVSVTLQGVPLNVLFAGAAPGLVGVDQINAFLPPEAAGLGLTDLIVRTTFASNAVQLRMGGALPNVRATPVSFEQTVNGTLEVTDQIQQLNDGSRRTYFFDAYRFTTTQANTTIAVDVRADTAQTGNPLDAAVVLYRINGNSLDLVGEDDQSGGYGNGRIENNNALLLMVLPTPGDYVFFTTSSNEQPNGVGRYIARLSQVPIRQINYGQTLSSETIATTDIRTSANCLFDVYWFNAAANDNITIRMTSTAFAAFVVLQPNGEAPALPAGDAGQTGGTATITRRLGNAGNYLILATPFAPNATGAYTLSLARAAGVNEDDAPATSAAPARPAPSRSLQGRATSRVVTDEQ